jgi:hypothetical protein
MMHGKRFNAPPALLVGQLHQPELELANTDMLKA